jgi:hypothetical protein
MRVVVLAAQLVPLRVTRPNVHADLDRMRSSYYTLPTAVP